MKKMKKNGLSFLVLFFSVINVFGQASVVAGSTSTNDAAAYVPSAGSNRIILVSISDEEIAPFVNIVSSVTWNGIAMTQILGRTMNQISLKMFYLDEAGITAAGDGTNNFVINWLGGWGANPKFEVVTIENVNQITPIRNFRTERRNSATTIRPNNRTVQDEDLAYYAAVDNRSVTHSNTDGYTETTDNNGGFTMATARKKFTANGTTRPRAQFTGANARLLMGVVVIDGVATAPGGVTGNLSIWLKAGTGLNCGTDGCSVNSWASQGPTTLNMIRTSGTATYEVGEVNYNDVVDAYNVDRTFSSSSVFIGRTIIYAGRTALLGNNSCCNGYLGFNGDKGIRQRFNNVDEYRSNGINSDWNDWTKNDFFYYNGTADNTGNIFNTTTFHIGGGTRTSAHNNRFYIGGYYPGRIFLASTLYGEVIVYSDVLTATERRKVYSYLGIKYGTTLTHDYVSSSNMTFWDVSADAAYQNDVIGIGRDDASGLEQKQSHSMDDSIRVFLSTLEATNATNSGTVSADENFLMIGHNGGKLQGKFSEKPGGIYSRLEREWKVVNTGFTDTYSIEVEWESTNTFDISHIRLLVDVDGNFSNATVYGIADGLTFTNGSIIISGINTTHIPLNSSRFITIGSVNESTPLPIKLVNFKGHVAEGNSVRLEWETVSETNNDYFTIERSIDASTWEDVTDIDGAGSSTTSLFYTATDENPYLHSSYYRLKQTDFDGTTTYSNVIVVDIEEENINVVIYPNPTESEITVESTENELIDIKIFNTLGQEVTNETYVIDHDSNHTTIDLSTLEEGIYLIKTKHTNNKVHKQ